MRGNVVLLVAVSKEGAAHRVCHTIGYARVRHRHSHAATLLNDVNRAALQAGRSAQLSTESLASNSSHTPRRLRSWRWSPTRGPKWKRHHVPTQHRSRRRPEKGRGGRVALNRVGRHPRVSGRGAPRACTLACTLSYDRTNGNRMFPRFRMTSTALFSDPGTPPSGHLPGTHSPGSAPAA